MKRYLAIILALCLCLGLCACGDSDKKSKKDKDDYLMDETYVLCAMESEGETLDKEILEEIDSLDGNFVEFRDDGTVTLSIDFDEIELEYDEDTMFDDDQSIDYEFEDDLLLIIFDDDLIFYYEKE